MPVAFNEAYWYGRGDDDRLVSDISERYPDPPSPNVGDDQGSIEPSIEARSRSVEKVSENADADDEPLAEAASVTGILRRVRLRAEAERPNPFARTASS